MKRIFAISGSGRGAGKTTFANKVADQVYSVAGALRGELSRIYPAYDWFRKEQSYKDSVVVWEYDDGGGRYSVRDVLTEYGQLRWEEDPDCWIKELIKHLKAVNDIADGVNTVAVDDIRKMSELSALKDCFPGQVIHVHVVGKGAIEEELFDNDSLGAVADYWVEW